MQRNRKHHRSIVNVLDIASPGNAMKGYLDSEFYPHKFIEMKAIAVIVCTGTVEVDPGDIRKVCRYLPDCLNEEPADYYTHVHFHMACPGKGGKTAVNDVMDNIWRMLQPDGVFFFSMDKEFFEFHHDWPGMWAEMDTHHGRELGWCLETIDNVISSKFGVIYRYTEGWTDWDFDKKKHFTTTGKVNVMSTDEAAEIAKQFNTNSLECTENSAREFFDKFSDWYYFQGEYAVIAKKK